MELFLFLNFSLLAILGGLGLVIFKIPIHSALSLVVSLISIAGLYLLLFAKTLFLIQIVVYAGAIMVLSIFVMMFFNIKSDFLIERFSIKSIFSFILTFIIFIFLIYGLYGIHGDFKLVPQNFGEIKSLGTYLYLHWGVNFEIISILLTTALVGVVAMLKGKDDV